jgi:hypothetical protein
MNGDLAFLDLYEALNPFQFSLKLKLSYLALSLDLGHVNIFFSQLERQLCQLLAQFYLILFLQQLSDHL